MSDEEEMDGPPSVVDMLLGPLRVPQRLIAEIEEIAGTLRSLSSTASKRLKSIDERAGALVTEVSAVATSLKRVERKVDGLAGLEQTIETGMEGLREDLNARVLGLEQQIQGIQAPVSQIASHVAKIELLLPDPNDGPLSRLKDTLTKS